MSVEPSLVDKETITLGRYLYAAFDLFKRGATFFTGNDSASASAPITERTLASAGLTPISTRVTRQVPSSASILPQISTRVQQTIAATPLKVSKTASKLAPAEISEITTPSLTASIASFPSVLLGSSSSGGYEGSGGYGSSSSYAEFADKTYAVASSSFGVATPVIVPPVARPVMGSSSSSARPVAQTGMGSSSSSARPVAQTGVGSSSSSSSSVYSCYIPESNNITTPQLGSTYTLQCGNQSKTFSVLLYATSAQHYCPDQKTVNSAYRESTKNQADYKNTFGFFVVNNCFTSALDFLYYHSLENGLLTPKLPHGQARLDSFGLVGSTFMTYILLMHAAKQASVTFDATKNAAVIAWFDKLNTEYTRPYIDFTNNLYYVYSNKLLTYLHIKRISITDSRFTAILTKIKNNFTNTRNVAITENFSNNNTAMPYIQIISGTKTLPIIDTAGKPVLDSSGKPTSLTVTFNNDYFITSEYRANRVLNYHDYYLRLLFATLIVLKLKNAPQSFFDTIKSTVSGIVNTLRKLALPAPGSASNTPDSVVSNYNAVDLYTVWGGGYKPDSFNWSAISTTYGEYKYIFENVPMPDHQLMGFSISSDKIIAAFHGTAY